MDILPTTEEMWGRGVQVAVDSGRPESRAVTIQGRLRARVTVRSGSRCAGTGVRFHDFGGERMSPATSRGCAHEMNYQPHRVQIKGQGGASCATFQSSAEQVVVAFAEV